MNFTIKIKPLLFSIVCLFINFAFCNEEHCKVKNGEDSTSCEKLTEKVIRDGVTIYPSLTGLKQDDPILLEAIKNVVIIHPDKKPLNLTYSASMKHLNGQVSILPSFYEQFFVHKCFWSFFVITNWFCNVSSKEYRSKKCWKMLVKFITGVNFINSYELIFFVKGFCKAFMCWQFSFSLFHGKNIGAKSAQKLLVKFYQHSTSCFFMRLCFSTL